MDYQNIIISLKKDIIIKAKQVALKRKTSVSKLLSSTLEEITKKADAYEEAKRRNLALLDKGIDMGTKGSVTWSRADIYD